MTMTTSIKSLQAQGETSTQLGDWGVAAIAKHCRKFCKHEAGTLADQDPEELHQMRVGMRRLRSALRGFAPALRLPPPLSEGRVGKLARTLGSLRDLDVLQAALEQDYQPHLPPVEQQALGPVLQALQKQRRRAAKAVKRTLTGKRYTQLKAGFQAWLEQPQYELPALLPLAAVLPDLLLPSWSELLLHPAWLVGVCPEGDRLSIPELPEAPALTAFLHTHAIALHDLRKTAKRVRYQLELFAPCYGEAYQRTVDQVKAIQTVLGDVQDSVVLEEFLTRTLGSTWGDRLPALAAHLQAARGQKWGEWQALQRQFLDPATRHALRATLLPQPPTPNATEPEAESSDTTP